MDNNVKFVIDKKVERTIKALEKNNMNGYFVEDKEALLKKITELVPEKSSVAFGGSMSIIETGVVDFVRTADYELLDRFAPGLEMSEIKEIFRKSFAVDAYITSTNAITVDGELYNVDGTGNRVAAMMFGPEKVIVVCSVNKIVEDIEEAELRVETMAAPANAKRLDRKTPCAEVGYCMDCNSPDRICRNYTVIKSQGAKGRIHVIFTSEATGY